MSLILSNKSWKIFFYFIFYYCLINKQPCYLTISEGSQVGGNTGASRQKPENHENGEVGWEAHAEPETGESEAVEC